MSLEPAEISSFWRNFFCWVSFAKCKYKPQVWDGFLDFESRGSRSDLLADMRNKRFLCITQEIFAGLKDTGFPSYYYSFVWFCFVFFFFSFSSYFLCMSTFAILCPPHSQAGWYRCTIISSIESPGLMWIQGVGAPTGISGLLQLEEQALPWGWAVL